jgi:hypothetical protein
MKPLLRSCVLLLATATVAFAAATPQPIKAFCVDFNWGPGGPNGFAKPGLWADADPAKHVAWYEQLGCNVIQTFAVSCNGYAWYKGGVVPEQPGLKHDFTTQVVKLGHAKRMQVMGYFCVGANTLWGQRYPDLSYGFPSTYHIPFTDAYLDYLTASMGDALRKTGMDGFMIDWVWCPHDNARKQATGGKWLDAERKLYAQLMAKPFPGEDKLTPDDKLGYERKAINRCWARIRDVAKRANPRCVIWLSCSRVRDVSIAGSPMLKEVDWMMDEAGTPAAMKEVAPMFGARTRQLLCLAGWGDRHKTREILSDPAMAAYGIYGFSKPNPDSLPLPVATYLGRPIESFKGNDRGIATLARFFNGKPFDFATKPHAAIARPCWHKAPTLSVMTGFIYEPLKPYTIQQWMENLGSRFDADQWVKDFKEAGASHLVFYDKWIDGLVFHDTKTSNFKTKRDFVRELAAACQRGGLPLVLYFNAVSDGNPEFDPWSLIGLDGKPIVFGARWPTRYQTLHSPFRAKCLEQVREILGNYGPIHGIWHDIFHERLNTTSEWTARGYQKMFGEPFAKATPQRLAEFNARTLAGYLDEADAIRRECGQTQCVFTANGSGSSFLGGGDWTDQVGARLQYLFNEGHSFAHNEKLARMAWALPKPLDINLLLVSSWFTPLEDAPPPASLTVEQAIAATAIAVCQGAGVNFALTPSHDGRFGEDVQRAKAVGAWFRKMKPWLEGAQPAADIGIVHGPGANAASDALARAGVFSRWIASDQSPSALPAMIAPPQSRLDERLRDYVNNGGTLIAFGNVGPLADVFGANVKGAVRFATKLQGATVKVDSEYNEQFAAANLLDDDPRTAWASTGTPMPHWAEITLPEPVEVQTVELISRQGPYRVADVDIELPDGSGWRVAKSVRGAKERKIVAKLDAPAKTSRVRVKILRELFNGDDRQHADVEGIRVLDRAGQNHASGKFEPVRIVSASLRDAKDLSLPPSAVAVEPTTAEVLARFDSPDKSPALLCNRFGKGHAYLATSTALGEDSPFWAALCRVALGEPALAVSADDARRFRFILTRVGDARVLHVIDAAVPAKDYQPKPVEILLAARGVQHAVLAGKDKTLALTEKDGRLGFTVQPDPVATVVLKGARP